MTYRDELDAAVHNTENLPRGWGFAPDPGDPVPGSDRRTVPNSKGWTWRYNASGKTELMTPAGEWVHDRDGLPFEWGSRQQAYDFVAGALSADGV